MATQVTQDVVEQILSKLALDNQGGDPVSTPPVQPFTVNLNGQTVTANSQEELQAYIAKNDENIRQAFQAQQAQLAAMQAELEKVNKQAKRLNLGEPSPDVTFDADEFVKDVVGGKPVDAVQRAIYANPELSGKLNRIDLLEKKLAQNEFGQAHAFYNNAQTFELLDKIRERIGLGTSREHYEAAAALAIQNNLLPSEQMLRVQQQQAFMQLMQAQAAQQSGQQTQDFSQQNQNYPQPQPAQYNTPQGWSNQNPPMAANFGFNAPSAPIQPPPATPRNQGGYPNSLETAVNLADQGKLKGQALLDVINGLQPR